MGCNSSKAGKVGILEVSPKSKGDGSNASIDPRQRRLRKKNKGSSKSQDEELHRNDDDYLDPERGFSASSKQSKHSDDSGLGAGSDGETPGIITENSDPDVIQGIIKNFHERDASDLTIVGIGCQIRGASADKERMDERRILESLRQEGLITKPQTKSSGGVAFEVVEEPGNTSLLGTLPPLAPRPPPRLAKLEKRRKKKKIPKTREEIEQKLLEAQKRKQQKEEAVIAKAVELGAGQKASVHEQKVEKLEEEKKKDMDVHEMKRQQKLLQLQEKQRKREEHAERVRQRKLEMAALRASGDAGPDEGEMNEAEKPELPRGVIQVQSQPGSAFG